MFQGSRIPIHLHLISSLGIRKKIQGSFSFGQSFGWPLYLLVNLFSEAITPIMVPLDYMIYYAQKYIYFLNGNHDQRQFRITMEKIYTELGESIIHHWQCSFGKKVKIENVSLYRRFRPKKGVPGLAMQTGDVLGKGDSKTILSDFKMILDSIKNLEFYTILGLFIS